MELALLILRLFLVAIFGIAAGAKLADFSGTKKAVAEFGVPGSLSMLSSILLIAAELVVVALLLFRSTSWYGAMGAAALLGIFVAGMLYQLVQGRSPDCHCFGQISSESVGVSSVVRNVVFLVPAFILIYRGQFDQGPELGSLDRTSVQTILLIALIFIGTAAIDYLRRIAKKQDEIVRRIDLLDMIAAETTAVNRDDAGSPHDGLPIGAILPDFVLSDLEDRHVHSGDLVKERPAILFFISPTCEPCAALAPRIEVWANDFAGRVDVFFISSGEKVANEKKFGTAANLFLDEDRRFAKAVSARWTPSALLVGADRRIASHVAAGDVAITELAERALAQGSEDFAPILLSSERPVQHSVQVGERVPQFSVQAMTGETVSTESLHGKRTMLVFWGMECPHCVAMAPDLKAWESSKNGDSSDLIVFSDGDLETNRSLGLTSPIIIEAGRQVAANLGMFGTPSAILVDENSRFASEVAVGAPQIWALVGHNPNK